MLDFDFEVYSNSRTLYCSVTGTHVEPHVEPDIKVYSVRRQTREKEGRQPSSR